MAAQTHKSTRKYEILTGLILLGLTFGVFLLGEIGLRAIQYARFGVEKAVETSSAFYKDDESGIRLIKPNQQLGNVRINNLGYRGPDISLDKPRDTIRFLFLGSSTTYDANSIEGKNWPHMTVNLLSQVFPKCSFDFINAAQPGFGTEQIQKLYEAKLQKVNADFTIILPGDINQDLDWLGTQQGFSSIHYIPSALAEYSVLWAKVEMNSRIIKLQRRAFSRVGKVNLDLPAIQDRFRERISDLIKHLRDGDTTVLTVKIGSQLRTGQNKEHQIKTANTALFYMPNIALPDLIAAREGYNAVIDELAIREDFDVINSSLNVPANRLHYSDTVHFTTQGSKVMAEALVKEISEIPRFKMHLQDRGCTHYDSQ